TWIEAARVGVVVWIVHRECVRIACPGRAWNEERIAAQKSSDDWVIEPLAEPNEAKRRQSVAVVPLICRVADGSRLCAGGVCISIGLVLDVLDDRAGIVGGESVASLLAELENPRPAWPMPADVDVGARKLP